MKRKRSYLKTGRIVTIVTAALMLLMLSGCGKDAASAVSSNYKNCVYRVTDFEPIDEGNYINQLLKSGDAFYAVSYQWSYDGTDSSMKFSRFDKDGNVEKEYRISMDNGDNLSNIVLDEEENIYCINNVYGMAEGTDEYEDVYFLEKRTLEGKLLYSVKLNDILQIRELETDYLYVANMLVLEDQGIYISMSDAIFQFDMDGTFVKRVGSDNAQGQENALDGANLMLLEDGRVAAIMYEEGICAAVVDMETGMIIGEKTKLPGNSYGYSVYSGIGYDLYLIDNYGVYGYNIGDTDKTQLMSYVDSDCGFYNIYNVLPLNESEFIGMYSSIDAADQVVARFTKIPADEVKEKKVITLACAETDFNVTQAIVKFNKENEEYRILLQDYSSLYGSEFDYSAGLTKLNADIVSGKIPDILVLNSRMPVDSYISKGLFEDLKPYIENDSEMSMDDFMPNIIEAYSVDGKLYRLVPKFSIQTVAAKASDVGKERGWTVQEAMELWDSKPEGTEFMSRMTRENMLWYCISMSGGQFIDQKTGKCSFDSADFVKMLEFVARFPEETENTSYDDDYWINYDSLWRENKVLTTTVTLGNFQYYNYMEKGTFGEDITLIGFPSSDGDGSAIQGTIELAMSSKSPYKDGVWEFLRVYLLDEYQGSSDGWGFPLSIKYLDKMAEEATKRPHYEDENGNIVEYDDAYYIDGVEIIIEPMSEAEAQAVKEQLYTFDHLYVNDENLINIIKEEAAAYFNGQKKAEDVADIIQSRVQIYVNEMR